MGSPNPRYHRNVLYSHQSDLTLSLAIRQAVFVAGVGAGERVNDFVVGGVVGN